MQVKKEEAVLTTGLKDRRGRICRCRFCKIERRCTPVFDFWILKDQPKSSELACQRCFELWMSKGCPVPVPATL